MKFSELTEEEYKTFYKVFNNKSIYQRIEWGHIKQLEGYELKLVGIKQKDKVIAAALLLSQEIKFKKSVFWCPDGFLIDYKDKELLRFFLTNLKLYLKNHKAIYLEFQPYGSVNIGKEVNPILEEFDCRFIDSNQKILKFSTKNKTVDEIVHEMKKNTRGIIEENAYKGIIVKEIKYKELNELSKIGNVDISRYQRIYKEFSKTKSILVSVAYFNHDKYVEILNEEINILKEQIRMRNKDYDLEKYKETLNILINQNKNDEVRIAKITNLINETNLSKKENGNIINLGAIINIIDENRLVGLDLILSQEGVNCNIDYNLYFESIKYAVLNEMDEYVFPIDKTNEEFNQEIIKLLGQYHFVINKSWYYMYKRIKNGNI